VTERPRSHWPADVLTGVAVYAVTALPVVLGLTVATTPGMLVHPGPTPDYLTCCCHWDGSHYEDIVRNGYALDPNKGSNVAFFPGYPLAAALVGRLTGCDAKVALVVIANVALAAAFVLLSAYLRARYPGDPPATRLTVLAVIGLWPAGFFFRIAYSESLFLLALAVLLLGLARRWPVGVLALVAGVATGIRGVGVAASAAVVVNVLADSARGPLRRRVLTAAVVAPLACWGLLGFMAYQYERFGTPTAFIETQRHWELHMPAPDEPRDKWARLVLVEPVWNAYVPGSSRHWILHDSHRVPVLGIAFWDPLLFVVALVAVGVGWYRGWLTHAEAALGLGLLLVPYVTRADELSMGSHARFAAVVVPAYVVLGRALSRLPTFISWAVFATLAPVLALWTALFAASWPLC
jgi:hypothetical protein